MAYYLDIFSPVTYEAFSKTNKDVAGVREGHASYADKLRPGDKLICYLTKLSRWIGVLEVQSGVFRDETPRFYDTEDPYIIRLKVKPVVWLEKEKAIPIREDIVWNNLSLTKDYPKIGSRWTGPFRSSLNKLSDDDGKFLEDLLLSQVQKNINYEVDEDEYQKYLTQRVRSTGKDIAVSIPEDNGKEKEVNAEDISVRESIKIQAILAKVGEQMGFKIWIAIGDRSRVLREWTPEAGVLLDRLPISFDEVTLKTIERIDVLWIRRRAIARAFEVEHKTSIYSGILRMADLVVHLANRYNSDRRTHAKTNCLTTTNRQGA
jgi:predicted RNA-binding protein